MTETEAALCLCLCLLLLLAQFVAYFVDILYQHENRYEISARTFFLTQKRTERSLLRSERVVSRQRVDLWGWRRLKPVAGAARRL